MPKKPETLLSEKVLSRLRAEGGWWFKVHGGPFQTAGAGGKAPRPVAANARIFGGDRGGG